MAGRDDDSEYESDGRDDDAEGPQARNVDDDDSGSETVPCPRCGRQIYEAADRCPHCGEWIVPSGDAKRHRLAYIVVAVVAIATILAWWLL